MFDVAQLRLQIEGLLRDYPLIAEDEVLRADMFDGETDIRRVVSRLVAEIRTAEDLSEDACALRQDLKAREARLDHRAERLRELVLQILQSGDLRKLELPEATVSQAKGQPQIVGEPDAGLLPDDLVRIKREPNRTAIKEALLAHRDVPGLYLSNAQPHLVIKR